MDNRTDYIILDNAIYLYTQQVRGISADISPKMDSGNIMNEDNSLTFLFSDF